MIDASEQLPVLIDNLQTFQLVPVVLAVGQIRKQAAGYTNFKARESTCLIPVIEPLQLCHEHLVLRAPAGQLNLSQHTVAAKRPVFVIEQVVNRIRSEE